MTAAEWPPSNTATAACAIRDITEPDPIPKGATVELLDYWSADQLWCVEYQGRVYVAEETELKP